MLTLTFQLRLAIVECIGHMTHLMAKEKLEEQLPKILQGMLGLYKKHPEPFHITQVSNFDIVCFSKIIYFKMVSHGYSR